jgi:SAM-dependent methyltransferase
MESSGTILLMERCQPRPHSSPTGVVGTLLFIANLLTNFNFLRVYRDVRRFLKNHTGEVLDVGCGGCPFRVLVERMGSRYRGIDVDLSSEFGYEQPDILRFGENSSIPLPDASIDAILCTEVLEHVENPAPLVSEMWRVLKPGGHVLVTVPWSARYHYIPHDYYRYTPSGLRIILGSFSSVDVHPQGNDITAIVGKISVIFLRNAHSMMRGNILSFFSTILLFPVFLLGIVMGHLSLMLPIGSDEDPLGYAVLLRK